MSTRPSRRPTWHSTFEERGPPIISTKEAVQYQNHRVRLNWTRRERPLRQMRGSRRLLRHEPHLANTRDVTIQIGFQGCENKQMSLFTSYRDGRNVPPPSSCCFLPVTSALSPGPSTTTSTHLLHRRHHRDANTICGSHICCATTGALGLQDFHPPSAVCASTAPLSLPNDHQSRPPASTTQHAEKAGLPC